MSLMKKLENTDSTVSWGTDTTVMKLETCFTYVTDVEGDFVGAAHVDLAHFCMSLDYVYLSLHLMLGADNVI